MDLSYVKKKASASFNYIEDFYFYLKFHILKLNILRDWPTIILSSSNIKTFKARIKISTYQVKWEWKQLPEYSRLPNTIFVFGFVFISVSFWWLWQFDPNYIFMDLLSFCSQEDIWV